MLVKKILETYIDISDPNDIFSVDMNQTIMNKLNEKFVGICYNSCLIVKINKIIRRSYVYMKDTLDGDTNLNIMFEVDCIIYIKNEIINNCKIIKKETNGIIHATSKYAGIQLNIQPNMNIFKEGEIIPVIVKRVRYNISQNSISVSAMPFMPIIHDIYYYKIKGTLSSLQKYNIQNILDQIKKYEDEFKKLNANDKKIYKFFIDLLQQKSTSNILDKKSKPISIHDMTNLKSGIIYKKYDSYDNNTVMYSDSKEDVKLEDEIIEEEMYTIFNNILFVYLSHLQTLKDFIENYNTFNEVLKNKNIWKLFSMLKK